VERSDEWRVASGEFRQARNVQCHAHDRLDARFFRGLVKWHRRVQPIRVCQRHGRHFLLNRRRDNFFRRRYASQKRIVAMTMQMYEHVSGDSWKGDWSLVTSDW